MDHKDQHHEHHRHERAQHKKDKKRHEQQAGKSSLPVHPLWLLVLGAILTVAVILIWTFAF